MALSELPSHLNPRSVWHWAYYQAGQSVMCSALDMALLNMKQRQARWQQTKASNSEFGFSDSSAQIWIDQRKQHVRALIMQLPVAARALGNVLYLPTGDASKTDLIQAHNYLYPRVDVRVLNQCSTIAPKKRAEVYYLLHCAIDHYWDAMSPTIEGETARSMQPARGEIERAMHKQGRSINTRYWSREWLPIWSILIDEIRELDSQALAILDDWCQRLEHQQNDKQPMNVDALI